METILGRAMLAKVRVSAWEARKHDREVTDEVNEERAGGNDAGRYHKRLFGGSVEELGVVVTSVHTMRRMHASQTLPWSDAGWRLLPTANYYEYTKAMRECTANFETAVERFVKAYPRLVRQAREKLNGMYRAADYPEHSEVHSKFAVEVDYTPLPAGDDFRISLPKEELKRMAKDVETRVADAVADAMAETWQRLGDAVMELRAKLTDGKYLRDAMVTRVGDVAESLGRLNLTGDPTLEKARKQVLRDLAALDVNALRKDKKVRDNAMASADDILKQMKGLYAPAKAAK